MRSVHRVDKLTTFACRLYRNLEALTFRNPLGCNRYVQRLLYLHLYQTRTPYSFMMRYEWEAGKDMASAVACFKYHRITTEVDNCTSFRIILFPAVPRLRRSVSSLSPRSPGFNPSSIRVGFVVDKAALGQVFLQVLRFPPSVLFMLIHFVTDATKFQRSLTTFKNPTRPRDLPQTPTRMSAAHLNPKWHLEKFQDKGGTLL